MSWHLAQMNIGTLVAPPGDPLVAAFMAQLDAINALADSAPGFVWRLQSASGNATDIATSDDPRAIVNMSVWQDAASLFAFVYRSDHRAVMVRRREWFLAPDRAYQVLWWVRAGTVPTVAEGLHRLDTLRLAGPTAAAFSFKHLFSAPEAAALPSMDPAPFCVGWT